MKKMIALLCMAAGLTLAAAAPPLAAADDDDLIAPYAAADTRSAPAEVAPAPDELVLVESLDLPIAMQAAEAQPPAEVAPDGAAAPAPGAGPAAAPAAPNPVERAENDPAGAAADMMAAFRAGKILIGVGILLGFAVAILRWLAGLVGWSWLQTDRGGAVLVGVSALLTALSTAFAAGSFSWAVLFGTLALAWTAAGGRNWLSRLLKPKDV